MKFCCFVLLVAFCYVECRKAYVPIDKNANVAFINMEGGGARPTTRKPAVTTPPSVKPVNSASTPPPHVPVTFPSKVVTPIPVSQTTAKQVPVSAPQTQQTPTKITPQPMYPSPVAHPITTPGPGSVKQLINYYDSQGKASIIRPYSYSQAVKQG